MRTNQIEVTDKATGEVMPEGAFVYIPERTRIKESWFMAFQDELIKLAGDRALSGQPMRVLLLMLGKMNYENYVLYPQTEMAEYLGMTKQRVSLAIEKLIKAGVIFTGPKFGRHTSYRVNLNYVWKGKAKNWQKERAQHLRIVPKPKNHPSATV